MLKMSLQIKLLLLKNSIASCALNPISNGTLLNRPSFRIFSGCSVKNGWSYSGSESLVIVKVLSIDGTKAIPTFFRASSIFKVFGAESTICCGVAFRRNSVWKISLNLKFSIT